MPEAFSSEAAQPRPMLGQATWMSKSRRRVVRQHLALAAEANYHSVALFGAVWTLHHPKMQQAKLSANKSKGQTVATSRRSERRAQRQKDYISSVQAAVRFRLARFFKRWRQPNQQSPPLLLPPSMSSLAPPPPSQPMTKQVTEAQASSQQQVEQMDAGGRLKSGRSAPSAGDSPATPHAKRALRLPSGPPPPSLPPSPPSPNGGQQPPGPSGPNQTGEGVRRAGSPAAADVRAGSSRRLDFSGTARSCGACGETRGLSTIEGGIICEDCKALCNSESEPESNSGEESCVSACSDSEDDGEPGSRAEPERPNDKGYLKCEACDHWLPWLWDKKNSLCARCSGNRELRAWFDRELA